MQGCRTNQQIFECKLDAFCFLLAFNAPCQPCNVQRHGMHRQIVRESWMAGPTIQRESS